MPTFSDQTPIAPFENLLNTLEKMVNEGVKTAGGLRASSDAERALLFPQPKIGDSLYRIDKGYREVYYGNPLVVTPGWYREYNLGQPYAEAAGSGSNGNAQYTTINFPPGRFSVPPIVTGSTRGPDVLGFHVGAVTKDSAQVGGFDEDTNGAFPSSWTWYAVQMTPDRADG